MPDSAVYLLFALGAVLVIGGIARPHRLGNAVKTPDLSIRDRLRLGLHQYRRAGLILGALVIGLLWYAVSQSSSPDDTTPQSATQPAPPVESAGHRIFLSEFIEIELPGGWTATDVFGLEIPDLDSSQLPRAFQVSISAIPMRNERLHLFAFDRDYRTTLVILAEDTEAASVAKQLDQRWALYTWIGVPVSEMRAGLVINGMDAGTMVLEPMHRFELFRERQYLVTSEGQTYTLIFSTLAGSYQQSEPMFEEIAGSFRVLSES
ncbi:MAG: hypothetical protein IH872_08950 [Chloroflexi bacterium]|nr:hypothetical protein [Chloroflexota bacterium]